MCLVARHVVFATVYTGGAGLIVPKSINGYKLVIQL